MANLGNLMRINRVTLAVSFSVSAGMLLMGIPANADNYVNTPTGDTGCTGFNLADNSLQTFAYHGVSDNMKDATNWVRSNVFDPTDLTTDVVPETSTTDEVVFQADYSTFCGYDWFGNGNPGLIGLSICISLTGTNVCQRHEVRYDSSWVTLVDTWNRRALACHESSHALGITHRAASCMTANTPFGDNTLLTHETDWINQRYP